VPSPSLEIRTQQAKDELEKLQKDFETAIATVKVAMETYDSSKKRALQGEALFSDTKIAVSKVEVDIKVVEADIMTLERQETFVHE
jgi:hypothetical protein